MTFGEKILHLRKEANYTQEQLAELLEVSRQSVSKWESDIAYPETDKLIQIGKLFDCSMDYLLKENITDKSGHNDSTEKIKFHDTANKIVRCVKKINISKIISITIKIICAIVAIDIVAAFIYSLICLF